MEASEQALPKPQPTNEVGNLGDNKPRLDRISKKKVFGIVVLFFAITYFLTLLFSPQSFNFDRLSKPGFHLPYSTDFIKGADFYPVALKNFVPWAVVSPWVLAGHFTSCDELGCLFVSVDFVFKMLVLFGIYFAFFLYILREDLRVGSSRKKIIAVGIILLFVGYGASVVYAENLRPVYRENSFLSRLASISHKTPFPDGALPGAYQYGDAYGEGVYEGFQTAYIYQPSPSATRLFVNITFDSQSSPSEKARQSCPGEHQSYLFPFPSANAVNEHYVLTQNDNNSWTCMISYQQLEGTDNSHVLTPEEIISHTSSTMYYYGTRFGFLDQEHTVFVSVSADFGSTNQGGFTSEKQAVDALKPFFAFYK